MRHLLVVFPCMGKPPRIPGKRPPAPSVRSDAPDVRAQIVGEIYTAFERLDADEELLVGIWRDTLDDAEVLALLRDYNAGRPILHQAQ